MAKVRVQSIGDQLLISLDNSKANFYDKDKSIWSSDDKQIVFMYLTQQTDDNGVLIDEFKNEEIFRDNPENFIEPSESSVVDLLILLKTLTTETKSLGVDGWFDYNDLATSTTPISITGGAGYTDLTNDGLGAQTTKEYAPIGVSDLWDTSINSVILSDLKLGDQVDIRVEIEITTSSVNTEVESELFLGSAIPYSIGLIPPTNYKNTGTYKMTSYKGIYIGNTDTLNNIGKIKFKSDQNCDVEVIGWYFKITRF